jgi:hypothetical protein
MGCKTGLEPVTRGVTSRCAANCATCTKKDGSTAWDRTRDDAINSRALYLLSYREMKKECSPLTALSYALVQLALVSRMPALGLGGLEPDAAGGNNAAQQRADNALAELLRPFEGRCIFDCHGKPPWAGWGERMLNWFGGGGQIRTDVC